MFKNIEEIESLIASEEFISFSHQAEMVDKNLMLTLRTYLETQSSVNYDKSILSLDVLHFINECSNVGKVYESTPWWLKSMGEEIAIDFKLINIELKPIGFNNSWVYFDKICPLHLPRFLNPNESSETVEKVEGYYQLYDTEISSCSLLESKSIQITKLNLLSTIFKTKLINKTNYQSDFKLHDPNDLTVTYGYSVISQYDVNDKFVFVKLIETDTGKEVNFSELKHLWFLIELEESISFCQKVHSETGFKMTYHKPYVYVNLNGEVLNNPPLPSRF